MDLIQKWQKAIEDEMKSFLGRGFWFSKSRDLDNMLNGRAPWTSDALHQLCIKWYSVRNRIPSMNKRTLRFCANVNCPSHLQCGYEKLKSELQRGADLLPRMSRSVKDFDACDGMFNEWGIQHFHLGDKCDTKHPDMIQGNDDIAYVYMTDADAYIITIDKHGKWADSDLLKELLRDYPQALSDWEVGGADLSFNPDGKDRIELRKSHINSVVEINGKIYMKPLGGVQLDGSNSFAVFNVLRDRKFLKKVEAGVEKAALNAGWSKVDIDSSILSRFCRGSDWLLMLQKHDMSSYLWFSPDGTLECKTIC